MAYLPVSAFQRPMTHLQLQRAQSLDAAPQSRARVDKWTLFRALVKAREHFGVTARDLALLQGLLTFYPHEALDSGRDMILFPSNRAICERMNGLADSTMRRHLRRLVAAGLLLRRDSHNGKRFAVSYGAERLVFGFDLSPLLHLSETIQRAAAEREAAAQQACRLRLEIRLMRRDLFALRPLLGAEAAGEAAAFWQSASQALRRKLALETLQSLHQDHQTFLRRLKAQLLDSTEGQNEQHIQISEKEDPESRTTPITTPSTAPARPAAAKEPASHPAALSLETVLQACPEIHRYSDRPITNWSGLIRATNQIYRAIGVSEIGHQEAVRGLGAEQAAVVIAALLQMFDRLRAPGAYLRALVAKAAAGAFTSRPMILALLPEGRLNSC